MRVWASADVGVAVGGSGRSGRGCGRWGSADGGVQPPARAADPGYRRPRPLLIRGIDGPARRPATPRPPDRPERPVAAVNANSVPPPGTESPFTARGGGRVITARGWPGDHRAGVAGCDRARGWPGATARGWPGATARGVA